LGGLTHGFLQFDLEIRQNNQRYGLCSFTPTFTVATLISISVSKAAIARLWVGVSVSFLAIVSL
jgi:hypothetical protein